MGRITEKSGYEQRNYVYSKIGIPLSKETKKELIRRYKASRLTWNLFIKELLK